MNKSEFVEAIAAKTGMPRTDALAFVDAFTSVVTESLKQAEDVRLVGFGTFSVARREACTGRNPRTREVIPIGPRNQPKFRAGKALKEAVN